MSAHRPNKPISAPPAEAIDTLYGLEPVFEPGEAGSEEPDGTQSTQFVPVRCPYCGESFDTQVDVSAGSASYIEDCQVCCQPIEMGLEVDDAGELCALTAARSD
jgi:Cysteine-rich CPXCG